MQNELDLLVTINDKKLAGIIKEKELTVCKLKEEIKNKKSKTDKVDKKENNNVSENLLSLFKLDDVEIISHQHQDDSNTTESDDI